MRNSLYLLFLSFRGILERMIPLSFPCVDPCTIQADILSCIGLRKISPDFLNSHFFPFREEETVLVGCLNVDRIYRVLKEKPDYKLLVNGLNVCNDLKIGLRPSAWETHLLLMLGWNYRDRSAYWQFIRSGCMFLKYLAWRGRKRFPSCTSLQSRLNGKHGTLVAD